jgi:hypothetical protein
MLKLLHASAFLEPLTAPYKRHNDDFKSSVILRQELIDSMGAMNKTENGALRDTVHRIHQISSMSRVMTQLTLVRRA